MKRALCLAVFLATAGAFVTGQQSDRAQAPGRYIVVFKDTVRDVPGLASRLAQAHGGTPIFVYQHALKGFAVALPEQAAIALSRNPNVAYVEPDSEVWAFGTQTNPTWGLDRIDQRALPLSGSYTYDQAGAGVTAYIIDTGIRIGHDEFGGRAEYGYDFVDDDFDADDCAGHGTHVAGTVGGTTYGVAKGVSLVAVRVLGCDGSGTTSGVIAGIDWVTANAVKPAVANMSLGGPATTSLDDAVRNSIAAGVGYAIAAGNGDWLGRARDACRYSPARVAEAMTVSATNSSDVKASWANYGNCVDWFAPGVSISSAWYTSNSATNTISGTSMATPHTTGVAALYLETHPLATPQEVRDALYDATTKGVVLSSSTANNHLLYNLFGAAPVTNQAPTADFGFAAEYLTATFTDRSTDPDGTIASWNWSFGDGATSTEQNPAHTYGAAGTYAVTLTVTDDEGASDSTSRAVAVLSPPVPEGISLTATAYKVRAIDTVDLAWTGATTTSVDVYLDGGLLETTANDGSYTSTIGKKATGSYTYQVCETASTTCSNAVTVVF